MLKGNTPSQFLLLKNLWNWINVKLVWSFDSLALRYCSLEDFDTATSLINLAVRYHDKGAYDKAEPLYKRALEIREKVLGPEHLDTAASLNNLAVLYHDKGAYDKAEPLYKQALEIHEKVLGRDLKPFITRLCKVHAKNGSFAVPETREIGAEFYRKYGHDGMVAACDAINDLLGDDAIDLVYELACIAWHVLLPRLREMLDRRGLQHIAIVNDADEPFMGEEQLNELFAMRDPHDISFSFQPNDPNWRIYEVEGAPFEKWANKAKAGDFFGTPVISLSVKGKWEIRFGYEQGLLPAEVFDDEQSFLTSLMDCLVRHFSDRVYTLRVWVSEGIR